MPVVFDTGILYAYYDRGDSWHERAVSLVRAQRGGLVVPAPIVPEVDYLLGARLGVEARAALYDGIVSGDYLAVDLPPAGYERVRDLNRQFADLDLGFVDAAVFAVGEALGLKRVASADRRHFEPVAAVLGFDLVP